VIGGKQVWDDREAMVSLLKRGSVGSFAQHQTIDLETNQELPRLAPVLCALFPPAELADLLGKELAAQMLNIYQLEMVQNLFLEHELQTFLRAFHQAHIPLILLKGPVLAYTAYPEPHLRTYHDIDALIQPHDLPRARDLLEQQGYEFYEEYRSNLADSNRAGYNFLKKHTDSWLEVLIELHTAPHPSEIGTRFDVAALWEHAQPLEILGEPTSMLNATDHLLYLCWHYRFHSFGRLLWFYDLVWLLRATEAGLDWDALISHARDQKLAATLYYCLSWCRDLFGIDVPAWVFTGLRPPSMIRLLVERVAIPDVVKALTTPAWEERRILAHRVMVDSVGELGVAAWRALFPLRATIRQRYMEHSRLPLQIYFVFYFVHPWVTLAKGCRYLWRRIARRVSPG